MVKGSMRPPAQDLKGLLEKIKVGEDTYEVKVKGTSGMRLIHTTDAVSVFQEHSLLSVPSFSEPCEEFPSPGLLWRLLDKQNPYLYTQKQIRAGVLKGFIIPSS